MMNKTILMLSVSCMSFIAGADLCYAGFNPDDTPPVLNAAMLKSHVSTHTSHLTAAHLSSLEDFDKNDNKLIQLAATCFVTDTSACSGNEFAGNNADDNGHGAPNQPENNDDYDLDNAERCRQEGYTQTSCPPGYDKINLCPYDNSYFETCQEPCPDNYVACEPPYYGVGTACGNKYASCEKDTERACKELNPNYTNTCGEGQQLSSDRCSYDSSYGTCCNTCAGYPYTADTIPEGYVQDGEACTDCDGQEHFKVKPNPCDGFMDCGSMGPEAGANSCLSGTTTKYDNCKPCPNLGTLTSCPAPFTCTYEECSNRYYKSGCQSDYDWNASSQTCTCDSSYKYACTGTDQKGSGQACDGKYKSCTCSNGKTWNGKECVCDSSYKYTCNGTNESPSGTSCGGKYQSCECSGAYVWDDNACVCWDAYKYSCTGSNEAGGVGKSCNNKYMLCNCQNGYVWGRKDGACVNSPVWGECSGYAKNCTGFDYLYSDGTCYPFRGYAESLVIPGKTPIAEVIATDGNCGYAVALTNAGTHQWAISNSSPDIPELIRSDTDAKKDYNSCLNTQKILAAGDKNTYPAAWAAHEYKTEGTNAGDWCLPAAGLISSIYFNTRHFTSTPVRFWSSTVSQDTVTETYMGNSTTYHSIWLGTLHNNMDSSDDAYNIGSPEDSSEVRPVIEF